MPPSPPPPPPLPSDTITLQLTELVDEPGSAEGLQVQSSAYRLPRSSLGTIQNLHKAVHKILAKDLEDDMLVEVQESACPHTAAAHAHFLLLESDWHDALAERFFDHVYLSVCANDRRLWHLRVSMGALEEEGEEEEGEEEDGEGEGE